MFHSRGIPRFAALTERYTQLDTASIIASATPPGCAIVGFVGNCRHSLYDKIRQVDQWLIHVSCVNVTHSFAGCERFTVALAGPRFGE